VEAPVQTWTPLRDCIKVPVLNRPWLYTKEFDKSSGIALTGETNMNILLPTDGSGFSFAAARACAKAAVKEENAVIRIISVIEMLVPDEPFDTESDYYKAVVDASKAAAEEWVEQTRSVVLSALPDNGTRVETKTVSGKADRMIIKECETWPADLVVIASHGEGFWARTLLGSVTDSVVHHAPCSVLIVRQPKS